jgi:hypothetical protein
VQNYTETQVILDESGGVSYFFKGLEYPGATIGRIDAERMQQRYPKLAQRIEECEEPLTLREPLKGLLGKLGIKRRVKLCPAFDFDPNSSESVVRYFDHHN